MVSPDQVKGLSPAMQSKYWKETIHRESKDHLSHSLNTNSLIGTFGPQVSNGPPIFDFYADTWKLLDNQYHKAAGSPSPMVHMARRLGNAPEGGLEPLPLSNRLAMARSSSGMDFHRQVTPTPPRMPTPAYQPRLSTPMPQNHNPDIMRLGTPAMSERSRASSRGARSVGAYSQASVTSAQMRRPNSRGSSRSHASRASGV